MKKFVVCCLLLKTVYASDCERLSLHGGSAGNQYFQEESAQIIKKLTTSLTKARQVDAFSAEDMFDFCGAERQRIAKRTESFDKNYMGRPRLKDQEYGDRVFSHTPMELYSFMGQRTREFLLSVIARKIPSRNNIIPISDRLEADVQGRIIYEYAADAPRINPTLTLTEAQLLEGLKVALTGKLTINQVVKSYAVTQFQPYMKETVQRPEVSENLRVLYMEIFRKINGNLMPERSVIAIFDGENLTDPKMPMCLIHPIARTGISEPYLNEVKQLFTSAVLHTGSRLEKKQAIAVFLYRFSVFMPYARGSAAIGEWLLQALCNVHELPLPYKHTFSHVDQLAQSSFCFGDFWMIFKVFWFEPIVLEISMEEFKRMT